MLLVPLQSILYHLVFLLLLLLLLLLLRTGCRGCCRCCCCGTIGSAEAPTAVSETATRASAPSRTSASARRCHTCTGAVRSHSTSGGASTHHAVRSRRMVMIACRLRRWCLPPAARSWPPSTGGSIMVDHARHVGMVCLFAAGLGFLLVPIPRHAGGKCEIESIGGKSQMKHC